MKVFEMSVLRKILGVTRRDRKRNVDIMKTLDIDKDIIELLRIRRPTYFGHVCRMPAERFPHIALFGRTEGSRTRGRFRHGRLNQWAHWARATGFFFEGPQLAVVKFLKLKKNTF